MKIHIFYSHYEVTGTDGKCRPNWFDYEKCFINLLDTIEGKNIDLHLIMDGKVENNWIKKYEDKYITHEIIGGNMRDAGWQMFKLSLKLDTIEDNDLIYFLENDYLHVDNWVEKVEDLYKCFGGQLSYVSLYDHGDKYWHPNYDNLVSKIFASNTHHWRTMMSTCGSFIVTKKLWKEDCDFHTSLEGDHNKWLAITEEKGRFLLTAVPGLSTHCMSGLLSPTINWEQINK